MRYTLNVSSRDKIANFIRDRYLPSGLGNEEASCSIASINLALFNHLGDDIPDCMSPQVGRWIIGTQDEMSDELRNSEEWKFLLPLAAGTGRKHEETREAMIQEWDRRVQNYGCDGSCDCCDDCGCDCNIQDRLDPVAFLRRLIEVSHIIPEPKARARARVCQNCAVA